MKEDVSIAVEPLVQQRRSPYSRSNVRQVMLHYLFGRILSGAAGLVFVVLLVRHMDASHYARFATMSGLAATLGLLSGLGLDKAVTRFVPEGRARPSSAALSRFVWQVLLLRVATLALVTMATIAVWPPLAARLFGAATAFPAPLAALMVTFNLFQFLSLILQALVQQKALTRVLVVQWGGRLLLALALLSAMARLDLHQALWIMVLPDGIGCLALLGVIARHLSVLRAADRAPADAATDRPWPAWAVFWNTALHNYGYAWLIAAPQGNAMVVIASLFIGAPQVAAYGFFVGLVERIRMYLPLLFMLNLAEPVLIASYVRERDFHKLCLHSQLLYKLNFLLLMLLLAWSGAVAPALTELLTGGKYGAHAMLLPLLLGQVALGSHNTILQIIVNSVGRSDILSKSGTVALACMMLVLSLSIRSGALSLLFLAPLAYETANAAATVWLLRRGGFPYPPQIMLHVKLALTAVAAYLGAREVVAYLADVTLQLIAAGATVILVFLLAAVCLRMADMAEIVAVRRLLRRADAADR